MAVGCSGLTSEKWERLERVLVSHLSICREIMPNRRIKNYWYGDFYAGCGLYSEEHGGLCGQVGSPIRALRLLDKFEISYQAFFSDPKEFQRLKESLSAWREKPIEVVEMECSEAVELLIGERRRLDIGLAFFDPNGQPDWTAISRFARKFGYIDILVNVNSVSIKRCTNNPKVPQRKRSTEYLRGIGKKDIYLWEPLGNWQFCLAYCTNGPFREFRSLGFHKIDSIKGQCIARRIDHSEKEQEAMGGIPGLLSFGGEYVY